MSSQNQKTLTKAVLTASFALAPVLPSRATPYDGDIIPEYAQGTPIPEAQFSPVSPDEATARTYASKVKGRISVAMEFELSIANAIKGTKVGDMAGDIAAHKISVVIYDKDE